MSLFAFGNQHRPPELVIQDELHLISGALGSIVGLYEVGFESILVSRGVYPKFIASTATIRQAPEQVQSLFGREKMTNRFKTNFVKPNNRTQSPRNQM
jgi:ATP-dependent helicase YprA (DUF1998 family)